MWSFSKTFFVVAMAVLCPLNRAQPPPFEETHLLQVQQSVKTGGGKEKVLEYFREKLTPHENEVEEMFGGKAQKEKTDVAEAKAKEEAAIGDMDGTKEGWMEVANDNQAKKYNIEGEGEEEQKEERAMEMAKSDPAGEEQAEYKKKQRAAQRQMGRIADADRAGVEAVQFQNGADLRDRRTANETSFLQGPRADETSLIQIQRDKARLSPPFPGAKAQALLEKMVDCDMEDVQNRYSSMGYLGPLPVATWLQKINDWDFAASPGPTDKKLESRTRVQGIDDYNDALKTIRSYAEAMSREVNNECETTSVKQQHEPEDCLRSRSLVDEIISAVEEARLEAKCGSEQATVLFVSQNFLSDLKPKNSYTDTDFFSSDLKPKMMLRKNNKLYAAAAAPDPDDPHCNKQAMVEAAPEASTAAAPIVPSAADPWQEAARKLEAREPGCIPGTSAGPANAASATVDIEGTSGVHPFAEASSGEASTGAAEATSDAAVALLPGADEAAASSSLPKAAAGASQEEAEQAPQQAVLKVD